MPVFSQIALSAIGKIFFAPILEGQLCFFQHLDFLYFRLFPSLVMCLSKKIRHIICIFAQMMCLTVNLK